jgi:riboflavin kinase/FMN adenylyltransferase
MPAVTNIGFRPTFNETNLTIETFVLSAPVRENAGKSRLELLYRLRDERKFASAEELRAQIALDVARAQKFFRLLQRRE